MPEASALNDQRQQSEAVFWGIVKLVEERLGVCADFESKSMRVFLKS